MKRAAAALAVAIALGASAAEGEIRLAVDRYGKETRIYRVLPAEGRLESLPEARLERWPDRQDRLYARQRVGRELAQGVEPKPTWAEFSPDCRRVLLQFNDRSGYKRLKPPEYGEATPWRKLGEVAMDRDTPIHDAAWSADGRYLVVLEYEERVSKTPGSMFRYLFGHGDILATYTVSMKDTVTGKSHRVVAAEDVSGRASLLSALPSCPLKPAAGS